MDNLTRSCVSSIINFFELLFRQSLSYHCWNKKSENLVLQAIVFLDLLTCQWIEDWKLIQYSGWEDVMSYIYTNNIMSIFSQKRLFLSIMWPGESFHILLVPFHIDRISQNEFPKEKDQSGNIMFPPEITWLVFVGNRKRHCFLPNILRNIKTSNYANRCSSLEMTFIL